MVHHDSQNKKYFIKGKVLQHHYEIDINNNGKEEEKKYMANKIGHSSKKNNNNGNTNDKEILSKTETTNAYVGQIKNGSGRNNKDKIENTSVTKDNNNCTIDSTDTVLSKNNNGNLNHVCMW